MKKIMDWLYAKYVGFVSKLMICLYIPSAMTSVCKRMISHGEDVSAFAKWRKENQKGMHDRLWVLASNRMHYTSAKTLRQFWKEFARVYVAGMYMMYKGYTDRAAQMLAARDKENLITTD